MQTIYRTEDGKEFNSYTEADEHEKELHAKEYSKFVRQEGGDLIFNPHDWIKNVSKEVRCLIGKEEVESGCCNLYQLHEVLTGYACSNCSALLQIDNFGVDYKIYK